MKSDIRSKGSKRYSLIAVLVTALVVGMASFIAGTRANEFITWVSSEKQNQSLPAQLDYMQVQQVYDKLRQDYDGKLDANTLLAGAIHGMVSAAGDPYTEYFTKSEAQQFNDSLNGTFSGIGAELDKQNNQLVVVSTLDNSPASEAGLQAGDKILQVNNQDTSTWSIDKAVSTIRGDAGTTVKLSIQRGADLKTYSIVRAEVTAPSVTWQETNDNIGYMRISEFNNDTPSLSLKVAQEFKNKNVKGVILDLRGNGGGYLTAAQAVASLWLDNKVVVQERRGDQIVDTLRSSTGPILGGIKTIVLVDGGSASASEIVSGALHDNGAATLVGVKTFGKGSVQDFIDMPGGADLKVTVAKWYTPNGKNINKEGITPDILVPLEQDDLKNGNDTQKAKAIQLLNQ